MRVASARDDRTQEETLMFSRSRTVHAYLFVATGLLGPASVACVVPTGSFVPRAADHPASALAEEGRIEDPGLVLANPRARVSAASVQYGCPMHPDVRSNEPGKCPRCGMQLEKHGAQTSEAVEHVH